jgi:DNA-binding response OmpR family regulator
MTEKQIKNLQKPLIMVVDDVLKNLQVLGGILREEGYMVSLASSGPQALDMVKNRQPDLILLDVMMPEMDGFKVCEKLKSSDETKEIPVIFLTARVEVESVVNGFELGAVDYVTKPFNKAELLARVNTHLKLKQAQKEIIQLEQKNAVLAMALTASHELNQPLTVLKGNFDLYQNTLAGDQLTDKQQKYLNKMNVSLEKVHSLLKKFTDLDSINFQDYIGKQKMISLEDT